MLKSSPLFLFRSVLSALILLTFAFVSLPVQNKSAVKLRIGNTEKEMKYYNKRGNIFISIDELSSKFGIRLNKSAGRYELKFSNSGIAFSQNNPFVVIGNEKDKKKKVYQMPLSSVTIGGELYVSAQYSKDLIAKAAESKISFQLTGGIEIPAEEKPETAEKTFPLRYKLDEKTNGTLLRISSDQNLPEFESSLKGNNLKLKLNPSGLNSGSLPGGKGMIAGLSASSFASRGEINISLDPDFASYDVIRQNPKSILITVYNKSLSESKTPAGKKEKWNFNTVVIDAGHGGKDYGAVGPNNTIEKNINLAVALKLGSLIKSRMSDVRVVYTRSTDKFVELYKRGKIANENDGKLFLSIHCNSVANRSSAPNGYEVYLLRPGRTKEAIAIAEFENSVIKYEEDVDRYKKLTDENFILVSMAHSAYMRYSEKFSEILDRSFKQKIDVTSRGVKQAGFYVLVGASMPSVLIELGYVTNAKDASYMRSENGQLQYAESIFDAVKTYRKYYEEIIKQE